MTVLENQLDHISYYFQYRTQSEPPFDHRAVARMSMQELACFHMQMSAISMEALGPSLWTGDSPEFTSGW